MKTLGLTVPCLLAACLSGASLTAQTTVSTAKTGVQTDSGGLYTITSSGSITYTTNDKAALAVSANSTVDNSGLISSGYFTTSAGLYTDGSRGVQVSGGTAVTITNEASGTIKSYDDGIEIKSGLSPVPAVTVDNFGLIETLGYGQGIDFGNGSASAVSTITNEVGGRILSTDGDVIRPSAGGFVYNYGTIKSTIDSYNSGGTDGIDAQTLVGTTIVNGDGTHAALIEGARHGITGGNTSTGVFTMTITNNAGSTIEGDDGSGVNIDGINNQELVTITNYGTIQGKGVTGDGDGVDVDGLVNLTNYGTIKSLNSYDASGIENSEGVTVGGGTIVNESGGLIEGSVSTGNTTAVGRGITIAGVDKDTNGNAIPIESMYASTTVTNYGTIKGDSDAGIEFEGPANSFTATVNNYGTIEGNSLTVATLDTGNYNATVVDTGTIENDNASGMAIKMSGAVNTLTIQGNSASIVGSINGNGGTGSNATTMTVDLGAANYAFTYAGVISNVSTFQALSGVTTLSGGNTYAGVTTVGGGTIAATLNVDGTHTGAGNYTVENLGTLGGTGSISLASGNSITIDSGGRLAPGAGALTIASGNLNVSGEVDFALNGASAGIAGYNQVILSAGGMTLNSGATLDLTLGFNPTVGEQFTLVDTSAGVTGAFSGLAQGSTFTVDGTTFEINYLGGSSSNDIVLTTEASAVPEPTTWALILGAIALAGVVVHRRRTQAAG